jgi:hypothetical protein
MTQGEMLLKATVNAVIEANRCAPIGEWDSLKVDMALNHLSRVMGFTDETIRVAKGIDHRTVISGMLKSLKVSEESNEGQNEV